MEAKARHHAEGEHDPLAARLADGDPRAPRDLVERHQTELYRYAVAILGDRVAAEDAVQAAFERALAALGRYSEERLRGMRLRAWLYRVTLNVVRNALRLSWRETPEDPGKLSELAGVAPGERREGTMDVLAVLGRLPERQRTALALRYLQDLPYAEIAVATGWPEATARTLVRRGLGRLRVLIEIERDKGGDAA